MKIHQEALRIQMEKRFETQLLEQKKSYEHAYDLMKKDREAAENLLINQKQKAHQLEVVNYEIQEQLSSHENDIQQSIEEGKNALALSSSADVSNETFHVKNKDMSGKKRKVNLNEICESISAASPASAIIEEQDESD